MQMNYGGTDCSSLRDYLFIDATFKLGDASAQVEGARQIDYEISHIFWVAKTDDAAVSIGNFLSTNDNPECRDIMISVDVPADVTVCNLFPMAMYDVIKIEGSQLRSGDCSAEGMCESRENRATKLDDTHLTKVQEVN
jgi:hypothetical protein